MKASARGRKKAADKSPAYERARGDNRLQVRRWTPDDAFKDLPTFAPDWGDVVDEDLKISDTIHQRTKVQRERPGQLDWEVRFELFHAHKFACLYCGAVGELAVDHIIPIARGGTSVLRNLAPACRPCNLSKRAMPLKIWLASRPDLAVSEIERRWREAGRETEFPWSE